MNPAAAKPGMGPGRESQGRARVACPGPESQAQSSEHKAGYGEIVEPKHCKLTPPTGLGSLRRLAQLPCNRRNQRVLQLHPWAIRTARPGDRESFADAIASISSGGSLEMYAPLLPPAWSRTWMARAATHAPARHSAENFQGGDGRTRERRPRFDGLRFFTCGSRLTLPRRMPQTRGEPGKQGRFRGGDR